MITTTNCTDIDECFSEWEQSVDVSVGGLNTQLKNPENFAGQIRRFSSYGLEFTNVRASGLSLQRQKKHSEDRDNKYFYLIHQARGISRVQQEHSCATLQSGDMVLLDSNQPFAIEYAEEGSQYCFHIPRDLALNNWRYARILTAKKVAADTDMAILITPLLEKAAAVASTSPPGSKEDCLLNAVLSLLQPLFTQTRDRSKEYHSIYLQKAMTFVERNLNNSRIDAQMVASHLGISSRHLQRIFKTLDTSFSRLVREHRLHACANDLANPQLMNLDVTSIAFHWGFKDCAHFSRVFKEYYGLSPSQYRAQKVTLS